MMYLAAIENVASLWPALCTMIDIAIDADNSQDSRERAAKEGAELARTISAELDHFAQYGDDAA